MLLLPLLQPSTFSLAQSRRLALVRDESWRVMTGPESGDDDDSNITVRARRQQMGTRETETMTSTCNAEPLSFGRRLWQAS